MARRQESPDLARAGPCQRGAVSANCAQEAPAQAGACSCHRLEQCSLEEKEEREPSSCQSVGKGEATFLWATREVCSRQDGAVEPEVPDQLSGEVLPETELSSKRNEEYVSTNKLWAFLQIKPHTDR